MHELCNFAAHFAQNNDDKIIDEYQGAEGCF
jgi:hypothetical protein